MLLLMMEQRACSGSPSRDKRLGNVALSHSWRSPKPVWYSEFTSTFFTDRSRYRPTRANHQSTSQSGPFPRSVTCGPLESIDEVHFVAKALVNVAHVAWRFDIAAQMQSPRLTMRFFFALKDRLVKIATFRRVDLTVNEFYCTQWHIFLRICLALKNLGFIAMSFNIYHLNIDN